MRQFYTAYEQNQIGQLPTVQLPINNTADTWHSSTTQVDDSILSNFFSVTFTHHLILLNKCKGLEERMFYMQRVAEEYWSVSILEHHIKENLFLQIGKLHHNFDATIETIGSTAAAELFKDKYLQRIETL